MYTCLKYIFSVERCHRMNKPELKLNRGYWQFLLQHPRPLAKVGPSYIHPLGPETVQHWTRRRRNITSSPLSCGAVQHRPGCLPVCCLLLWLEEAGHPWIRGLDCPTVQSNQTAQTCGLVPRSNPHGNLWNNQDAATRIHQECLKQDLWWN